MTQLILGPLAFKYPVNMLVYIFLSVPLESAYVAEELKYFMYKLNVRPQAALFCESFLTLITMICNFLMCYIIVILQMLS